MEISANSQFRTLFCNLLKARFPCLYISTWEEERLMDVIRKVAQDESAIKTRRTVVTWTVTTGMAGEGQPAKEDTRAPLRALEFVEKYPDPAIFIFKDFHVFFEPHGRLYSPEVIRKIRDIVPSVQRSFKPKNIVFISPSVVLPNDLQKDVTIVDFDLPTFAEIKKLLDDMIKTNEKNDRIRINLAPEEKERLAKAALGLTLQEAENAFAHAIARDGGLNIKHLDVILEEKRQIIKKTEILEFVKSDYGIADVGGLENLKRWLLKRDKSWHDSAQRYGLPAAKGILITGVPGCGKSLIAKAISSMWRLPLLRLDVGKIFSGLVGSSEENIRKAIKTAEAIAPSILWIDEIEKGFPSSRSEGDSGTSSRVFSTFLTWMQEKTAPVFVVATANKIDTLPPELLRKGRFDEIFFVDLPTRRERKEIFRLHMSKRLRDPQVMGPFKITDDVLAHLSELSEGYIGSEIEQSVISALFDAFSEDRAIRLDDFERAIRNTVPLSVTQAEEIWRVRQWADKRAVAATAQTDREEYRATADPTQDDVNSTRGGRPVDY